MNSVRLFAGAALALTSAWALAQNGPESLLPPGFDEPAPGPARPAPSPSSGASRPATGTASTASGPTVQSLPSEGAAPPAVSAQQIAAVNLPSLAELEKMSPEELEDALGLKPKFDIPPAARRSADRAGVLDESEGGMPGGSLAGQNASLVRAALAGNKGQLVSRWGHILLRRALASRLAPPAQMSPSDFAALRAALLVRMGEGEAARALVQDVDTGSFTPDLTRAALDAYVATADFTGICPAVTLQGNARTDPDWQISQAICTAFEGDGTAGLAQLDRAMNRGVMPKIDVLLAQKYAGAAGKAQRAVTIEWDEAKEITPWRYGLAIAVGLQPPAPLLKDAGPRYDYIAATAPMLGLAVRAAAADRAAGAGVLSSTAMVDLYGQLYADDEVTGEWSERATLLRDAYVAAEPNARLAAMQQLWNGAADADRRYSRQVLTAYAAARLPADAALADSANDLVASMLAAGLDRNALRWTNVAKAGTPAWAMLTLVAPRGAAEVGASAITDFRDADESEGGRRSAFLLAGLAGLGRVSQQTAASQAGDMKIDLGRQTRWTRLIDGAAEVNNETLVTLLAGVGMQGDGWRRMTPLYLYHIVSALNRVGLEAEARMIAAEAVARG